MPDAAASRRLVTTLFLIAAASPATAQLFDHYPPGIAERLLAQKQAENSAASKLGGQGLRYIFDVKRWDPGSRILVAFKGGDAALHKAIAEQAKRWERHANIQLDFGYDPASGTYRQWSTTDTQLSAHIRIAFSEPGYWSYVGTDSVSSSVSPNAPSMNFKGFADMPVNLLPQRWKTVVLHEFGHALGLHHEHQHPACANEFRWEPGSAGEPSVYEVFHDWLNWNRSDVDINLKAVDPASTQSTRKPDRQSVMFYAMPAQAFISGAQSPCFIPRENAGISKLDALGATVAYPKNPTHALQAALAYAHTDAATSSPLSAPLDDAEKAAVQSRIQATLTASKPLLYIQIHRESDRALARKLQSQARDAGFFVPGIENVSAKGLKSGPQVEVRYFRSVDEIAARQAKALLDQELGADNVRLVNVKSLASTVTRNLVEIWLP